VAQLKKTGEETRVPPRSMTITFSMIMAMSSVSLDWEVGDQMARQALLNFQQAYQLSLPETAARSDEDEVRRLFSAPRLETLAQCPGWYIQSTGTYLIIARRGTAAAAPAGGQARSGRAPPGAAGAGVLRLDAYSPHPQSESVMFSAGSSPARLRASFPGV
jgi:hypothetical protein